jgi:hypothetical protein
MKKSELKEAIKAEITSVLSEEIQVNEEAGFTEVSKKEIKFHLDQFYGGNIDGNDLANAIEEIVFDRVSFSDVREDEEAIDEAKLADQELDFEKEPTKTQLKRGSGSITRVGYKLADLTKRMRDKAKEYKAAEGEAKEKIKDELKDMTAEKKKLEKSL